jgi:RNA polymerase sigma-70 factor (ECF subfamily)
MNEAVPYNEPELLRQVAQGSEAAFRRLFDSYQRRLYTYAYKLTGSREITEDIVQDIFLKIWQKRSTLTTIINFSAYVHRMAHNEVYQGLRKVARETLVTHVLSTRKIAHEDAGGQLVSKEIHEHIQRLVDQLTPKQREVYILSREEGLKQQEIADRLGIHINTVKTHMVDALKFLRSELGQQYGPEALAIFVIFQLGNF